ncbi:MAG: thiamine-phosphate kinase, partial [Candidatus Omnitrophica bacterium]|nr:thiamine-phosphate kinase [Candidatus Omnitrophota bacterium]
KSIEVQMIKNEFALINRIRQAIREPAHKIAGRKQGKVIVGPGDDTAVLKVSGNKYLLFTCDCLVENVHFSLDYAKPQNLGWKALAINASDIAAMGGTPKYATISLVLNEKINEKWVDELYNGFKEFIKEYPLSLVGGNIARGVSSTVIDIAMIGEVKKDKFVKRSGAKIGDLIVVTGTLGDSKAGMEILKKSGKNPVLCKRHLRPIPRLNEIRKIISKVKLNSMIDISDGFTQDLFHILEESKVSASIDISKIPVSSALKDFAKDKVLDFALYGGEDYELLFTLSKKEAKRLPSRVNGTILTIVGEIITCPPNPDGREGKPKIFSNNQEIIPKGYNHFINTDPCPLQCEASRRDRL